MFGMLFGKNHKKHLKRVRIIQTIVLGLDKNSNAVHGLAK